MLIPVRVIAHATLKAFVRKRVEPSLREVVQLSLDNWYKRASKATWHSSPELKADFRAASIVSSERVVFNIKGNDYRLVALLDYGRMGVMVLWIGTHAEYDQIDVREVQYDPRRYFDSPDSQRPRP